MSVESEPLIGPEGLKRFLVDNGISKADAARALGVSKPALHCWLTGRWEPNDLNKQALRVWTNGRVEWPGAKSHVVKPFVPVPTPIPGAPHGQP